MLEIISMDYTLEIISWIATCFIIVSFLIDDIIWLRAVSMLGAMLWFIYAVFTNQPSLYFLNGVIIVIHIWKIIGLKNKKKK
tara:strand:- start:515 stop:760 length:246 start_codon:yes stop_codon:yes gene_type:complete